MLLQNLILFFGPPSPDNLSTSNTVTVSNNFNEDAKEMSKEKPPSKMEIISTDTNHTVVEIEKR